MAVRLQPPLIRGARGLLNWSIVALADAAGVSVSTVKRMEMTGTPSVSFETHTRVRIAFEMAGVKFLSDDGNGPGMRIQLR